MEHVLQACPNRQREVGEFIENVVPQKRGMQNSDWIPTILELRHAMRKPVFAICEQQRRRLTQSDQRLCCSLSSMFPKLANSKMSRF